MEVASTNVFYVLPLSERTSIKVLDGYRKMPSRIIIVRTLGIALVSLLLCAIYASELPELLSLTDNTANDFTLRSADSLVSLLLDSAGNVQKAAIKFNNFHAGLAFLAAWANPKRWNWFRHSVSSTPFCAHSNLLLLRPTVSANRPFPMWVENSPSEEEFLFSHWHPQTEIRRDRGRYKGTSIRWKALQGGGFGSQLEGQETDFGLLLKNARATSSIVSSMFKLGGVASDVTGQVGHTGSGRNPRRDASRFLTCSRARGLFTGGCGETNLENCRHIGLARRLSGKCLRLITVLSALLAVALASGSSASAQVSVKKDVLILNEVGLSHALTDLMTQQIVSGVRSTAGHDVEFFTESLDLLYVADKPAFSEREGWLAKQYGGHKFEVVVAIGPDTIRFLASDAHALFSGVPIVICGSSVDQAGTLNLESRFTGTWQKLEPATTLEAALRLFPNTRHVFVVGGSSAYDRVAIAAIKGLLSASQPQTQFSYLIDTEMGKLLEELRNLPGNSIVFYISFFQDSGGNRFLNATKALPMIASAANAPVFGMSDTYLGHGIVGGDVMNFREQGRVTAQIVSELLDGEKPEDIPIKTLPSMFMFDSSELKRWHVPESRLPYSSVVVFREPSLWDRTKWLWVFTLVVALALSLFGAYLQYSQRQLRLAKERERHSKQGES